MTNLDNYARKAEQEWERLLGGGGVLEFAVTKALIEPHLPAAGRVLDIGGGTSEVQKNIISRRKLGLPKNF